MSQPKQYIVRLADGELFSDGHQFFQSIHEALGFIHHAERLYPANKNKYNIFEVSGVSE